jgi:hypothetical protein
VRDCHIRIILATAAVPPARRAAQLLCSECQLATLKAAGQSGLSWLNIRCQLALRANWTKNTVRPAAWNVTAAVVRPAVVSTC